jgi:hypothetical protein
MSQLTPKQDVLRLASLSNGIALYRRVMLKFTQTNASGNEQSSPNLEDNYIASKLTDKILKNGEA